MFSSRFGMAEKLVATKLVNLPPTLKGRLDRMAALREVDANKIIRRGLIAELDRMEAEASGEAARMAKLRLLAQAEGGNVDAVLDRLLAGLREPELPFVTSPAFASGTEGGAA